MRDIRILVGTAVAISAWYGAGMLVHEDLVGVLMFTGPGALFGLGVGWLGHLFARDRFTWHTGLRSMIAGVVLLPPLFAAVIAFGGLVNPQMTYMLFAFGAWIALGVGLLLAIARRVGSAAARSRG